MKFILREAKIIDSQSPFHNKTLDILVVDGFIEKIAASLPNSDKTEEIKLDNLHVSQGWFDSSVSLGEPGFEERETISNGLNVVVLPLSLCNPTPSLLLTINHKLTLFRIKRLEVLHNFFR